VKNYYLHIILFGFLLFTTNVFGASYLMDPMPNKELAPDFILIGMDGKEHTLKELEGKFVLVNFTRAG